VDTQTLEAWRAQNLAALYARLDALHTVDDGTLYTQPSGIHFHVVTKSDGALRFWLVEQTNPTTGVIQSEIDLNRPLSLLEPYTRGMTLALLWQPQPAAAYVAGFGGGRIPLVLHHHFPTLQIDCTEIDPAILTVAACYFGIPDDPRLHITIADGRTWLAASTRAYDLLLLDVFLDNGYSPYRMATREFFELCRQRLQPGGVVALNLLPEDPFAADKAHTLAAVFADVWTYTEPDENIILLAGDQLGHDAGALRRRARELDALHHFDYPFVACADALVYGLGALAEAPAPFAPLHDATPPPDYFAGLPSFAAPFSRVAPDLPCPCGSGRVFQHCHGAHL
jgi:spermidine synthase